MCEQQTILGYLVIDERTNKSKQIQFKNKHFDFIRTTTQYIKKLGRVCYSIDMSDKDILVVVTDQYLFMLSNPTIALEKNEAGDVVYEQKNITMQIITPRLKKAPNETEYFYQIYQPRVSISIPELCKRMDF